MTHGFPEVSAYARLVPNPYPIPFPLPRPLPLFVAGSSVNRHFGDARRRERLTIWTIMDDRELTRLADMAAAVRPDWNHRSIRAFLASNFAARAFADVAVALAVVAVQAENLTPRLLLDHGPWWQAVGVAFRRQTADVGPGRDAERCAFAGHEHEAAVGCRLCAAEAAAGDVPEASGPPAVAPPAVVAVANRHRMKAPVPSRTGRDFAQTEPLREPATDIAVCVCGGMFVPDSDGVTAHEAVFGHTPTRMAATAEGAAS